MVAAAAECLKQAFVGGRMGQQRLAAVLRGLAVHPRALPGLTASTAASSPEGYEYRAHASVEFSKDLASPGPTPERLEHFYREGWLIIDDFVDSPWIPALREAGRRDWTAPG